MKNKLHITLAVIAAAMMSMAAWAQGPNNSGTYYKNADGKNGEALKTAMYSIISKKNNLSYDGLIPAYVKTDTRADGYLRDWYSNTTKYTPGSKCGSYSKEGDTYNREHSVPQSWGAPKADIVHVVPTDGYVNNRRGNYPFGEVGTVKYQSNNGYSKLGTCKTAGYSGTVFEPNDEVKGDIARIYFYMATCYEGTAQSWGNDVFTGNKYQPMSQWTFDMMMRWSKQDPIDEVEIARNNAIARNDVQGNRNPFVDYPGLEDYIWGNKKDVAFSYDQYEGSDPGTITYVSQPVISPQGGTYVDQVEVSITTATEGAVIYYTTNGADASEQSKVYSEPFTLTESATVKAIAVNAEGVKSSQTIVTYVIRDGSGGETPAEGTILLNSEFFGVTYSGSISTQDANDLVGTQNGVTVIYSLGEGGSNRYCNDSHIRLYQKNRLTVSVEQDNMTEIEFVLPESTTKQLEASTGSVTDMIWVGDAQRVVFNTNDGSGHIKISAIKVKLANSATGVSAVENTFPSSQAIHTLSGVRVDNRHLQPGIYIYNGKKIIVK